MNTYMYPFLIRRFSHFLVALSSALKWVEFKRILAFMQLVGIPVSLFLLYSFKWVDVINNKNNWQKFKSRIAYSNFSIPVFALYIQKICSHNQMLLECSHLVDWLNICYGVSLRLILYDSAMFEVAVNSGKHNSSKEYILAKIQTLIL